MDKRIFIIFCVYLTFVTCNDNETFHSTTTHQILTLEDTGFDVSTTSDIVDLTLLMQGNVTEDHNVSTESIVSGSNTIRFKRSKKTTTHQILTLEDTGFDVSTTSDIVDLTLLMQGNVTEDHNVSTESIVPGTNTVRLRRGKKTTKRIFKHLKNLTTTMMYERRFEYEVADEINEEDSQTSDIPVVAVTPIRADLTARWKKTSWHCVITHTTSNGVRSKENASCVIIGNNRIITSSGIFVLHESSELSAVAGMCHLNDGNDYIKNRSAQYRSFNSRQIVPKNYYLSIVTLKENWIINAYTSPIKIYHGSVESLQYDDCRVFTWDSNAICEPEASETLTPLSDADCHPYVKPNEYNRFVCLKYVRNVKLGSPLICMHINEMVLVAINSIQQSYPVMFFERIPYADIPQNYAEFRLRSINHGKLLEPYIGSVLGLLVLVKIIQ